MKWVTFEDAHVPEYRDPPGVERAAEGKDMTKMVLEGELDAAIFGGNVPTRSAAQERDPRSRRRGEGVVQKARHRADQSYGRREELAVAIRSRRGARGISHAGRQQERPPACPSPAPSITIPFGFEAVKPALELMSSYALEMKIIPRRYAVEELFDDTTRTL